MPVRSYHCQSFTAGCRCCLTVTDGDEQKQSFQGNWGKNLLDGCLLQIVNDRCWLMKILMKTGENKEPLRKALPYMWLLHPHRTVKRRLFFQLSPWRNPRLRHVAWELQGKSISRFLGHSQMRKEPVPGKRWGGESGNGDEKGSVMICSCFISSVWRKYSFFSSFFRCRL